MIVVGGGIIIITIGSKMQIDKEKGVHGMTVLSLNLTIFNSIVYAMAGKYRRALYSRPLFQSRSIQGLNMINKITSVALI